jgi:5-methylcytosine-specific restriction enzyme A
MAKCKTPDARHTNPAEWRAWVVRRNGEGCRATPPMDFLRSHHHPSRPIRVMPEPFIITASEEEIKRERSKARELRQTRWWKDRLARGVCYYCRRQFSAPDLTMDHIVPMSRGGKTTRGNVVPVCKECNNKKKYLLPMEWDEYMRSKA